MKQLTKAIYDTLAADSTLMGYLAAYTPPGGSPGKALFSARPIPPDAAGPWLVIHELSSAPHDTKTGLGRDMVYEVNAYMEATGSIQRIEEISERARDLLHRVLFAVAGFDTILTDVSGPEEAPTDEHFYGRSITLRVLLHKQP